MTDLLLDEPARLFVCFKAVSQYDSQFAFCAFSMFTMLPNVDVSGKHVVAVQCIYATLFLLLGTIDHFPHYLTLRGYSSQNDSAH